MNQIETLDDLRRERIRLKQKLAYHQHEMKHIADELNPVKQLTDTATHLLSAPLKNNAAIGRGIYTSIEWIMKKVLLRQAPFILKAGIPFVVQRLISAYIAKR